MRAGLLDDRGQPLQQLPGPFVVGCKNLLVGLVLGLALGLVVEAVVVVRLSQGKWKRRGYRKSGFGSLVMLLG